MRNEKVASGDLSSHSVPGKVFDGFSFIVYSRFVNRPVTLEAIQHTIDFLPSVGLTQGAHPGRYTPVTRVGNSLSQVPSQRPDATE